MGLWSDGMTQNRYQVTGTFLIGQEWKPYRKMVEAPNENQAIERIYTQMGSKHRLKRNYITIQDVTLIDGE